MVFAGFRFGAGLPSIVRLALGALLAGLGLGFVLVKDFCCREHPRVANNVSRKLRRRHCRAEVGQDAARVAKSPLAVRLGCKAGKLRAGHLRVHRKALANSVVRPKDQRPKHLRVIPRKRAVCLRPLLKLGHLRQPRGFRRRLSRRNNRSRRTGKPTGTTFSVSYAHTAVHCSALQWHRAFVFSMPLQWQWRPVGADFITTGVQWQWGSSGATANGRGLARINNPCVLT